MKRKKNTSGDSFDSLISMMFRKLWKRAVTFVCILLTLTACSNTTESKPITAKDIKFTPISKLDNYSLDGSESSSKFGLSENKFYLETLYEDHTEIMKSKEVFSYDLETDELTSLHKNNKELRFRDYLVYKDHTYYAYLEKNKGLKEPYKIYVIDECNGKQEVIAEGFTWRAFSTPRFEIIDDTLYFLIESLSPDSKENYGDGKLTFKLISYKDHQKNVIEEGSTNIKNYEYTDADGESLASTFLYNNGFGELLCTYRDKGKSILLHYVDGKWEKKELDEIIYLNDFHKDQVFYSTETNIGIYNTKTQKNLTLKENHFVLASSGISDKGFIYFAEYENGDRSLNLLQTNEDSYTLEKVAAPEGVVAIYMNNEEGIALGADHIYKVEY